MEMGVKGVDSGGRNIKLYQAEFSDMGPLAESLDARYSSPGCLVGGLKLSEHEVPGPPCDAAGEGL